MNRFAASILAAPLCAMIVLAGCKPAKGPDAAASASAAPAARPGLAVAGLRIVLPRIPGNPAALYFTLTNPGTRHAKLRAVYVDGATRADMHQTEGGSMRALRSVDLAPGAAVTFAPGGKHVMVYGVPGTWKAGDHPDVTLTFSEGDKISQKADVLAPGDADAMPGMKM